VLTFGQDGKFLALKHLELIGPPDNDQEKKREKAEEEGDAHPKPFFGKRLHRTIIN
jgi:hypothetical protein